MLNLLESGVPRDVGAGPEKTFVELIVAVGDPEKVVVPKVATIGNDPPSELAVVETPASALMSVFCNSASVMFPFTSASGFTSVTETAPASSSVPP